MIEEVNLYGVFVPRLLVLMVVAFLVSVIVRGALSQLGFYRHVWHRPLFDIALYIVLLGAVRELASLLT
jgi:hypothetical protein